MNGSGTTQEQIAGLTDEQAVLVLRIVVEHDRLAVPAEEWASGQDYFNEAVAASHLDSYAPPTGVDYTDGDLARAALAYHAESSEESADVIDQAIIYTNNPGERFGLETLALGGLVLAVLQTDFQLKRDDQGNWHFELHKKAISDATLARLITTFIGHFTNSGK